MNGAYFPDLQSVPLNHAASFFPAVVRWQATAGRHGLPWQGTRDPYRIWLSEVMLQQTQVSTVVGYYTHFLERFPDVWALAEARLDDVFASWTGLGYYSRARNLHLCAQRIVKEWGGEFPGDSQSLQQLPGIGPSTAAAIAAFCFGETVSIYDGNVKRVLARCLGYSGDLSVSAASAELHRLAQQLIPTRASAADMVAYTQGLMDLGATVCTRRRPDCGKCPVSADCVALVTGNQCVWPVKSKRVKRTTKAGWWLVARRPDGATWLVQRPPKGVWASLFCFPEYDSLAELLHSLEPTLVGAATELPPFKHVLTHRDWMLTPVVCEVPADWTPPSTEGTVGRWIATSSLAETGLPSPVLAWLTPTA